jgi:hypothetical protein
VTSKIPKRIVNKVLPSRNILERGISGAPRLEKSKNHKKTTTNGVWTLYFPPCGLFLIGVSLYVKFTNVVSVHRPSPDFVYQSCRKERDMPQLLYGDTVRCNSTSLRCPNFFLSGSVSLVVFF